jgi:hypothetical protein
MCLNGHTEGPGWGCAQWTTGFYDYVQYLQNSIPK